MGSLGAMVFFMNSGGAATVPSGVTVGWVSTNASIPTGWSRVTALDGRFAKEIATTGTNPGATGGATSHTHTFGGHTHSISHNHTGWGGSGAGTGVNDATPGSNGAIIAGHSHSMSSSAFSGSSGSGGPATWNTTSTEPASLAVIFISSDGTPSGIPNNAVCYFNGAAPTGFAEYLNGANRMWKGAAAGGDGGGLADTSSHSHASAAHGHSLPAHTHTMTLDGLGLSTVTGNDTAGRGSHTHTAGTSSSDGVATAASSSPSTDAGDTTPAWKKMLTIQNTSGVNKLTSGLICVWRNTLASIPTKWALCDGLGGRPNLSEDKYVRGASGSGEVGTTGGATTHIHTGGGHTHTDGGATHSHTGPGGTSGSTTPPQSNMDFGEFTFGEDILAHTHAVSAAASSAVAHGSLASTSPSVASTSNDPLFTAVAYIQYTS